jgi:hypothetical protein
MEPGTKKSAQTKKFRKLKLNHKNSPPFVYCDEYFLVRSVRMDILIKKRKCETEMSSSSYETPNNETNNDKQINLPQHYRVNKWEICVQKITAEMWLFTI